MSIKADINRARLDEELSDLALSAVRELKKFLDSKSEPPAFELQKVKAAAPALSAWAKWEQTSTNRAALNEAISRRRGAELDALPAGDDKAA